MIQQATLDFFKAIADNNHKPWFEANKPLYEAAKANYLEFITALLNEIRQIEPIYEKENAPTLGNTVVGRSKAIQNHRKMSS